MDIRDLLRLKGLGVIGGGGGNTNLLDYRDLVNKNYSGNNNMYNVRPEHLIPVRPGTAIIITGPQVSEQNTRFYDENGDYQSSYTITHYTMDTPYSWFIVPSDSYFILPKWYNTNEELPVETFVASKPTVEYAVELYDAELYPITNGRYVAQDGTIGWNSGCAATLKFIPCEVAAGKKISLNKRPAGKTVPCIAFYSDSDEVHFISAEKNNGATQNPWNVDVPATAKYVRISTLAGATDLSLIIAK